MRLMCRVEAAVLSNDVVDELNFEAPPLRDELRIEARAIFHDTVLP